MDLINKCAIWNENGEYQLIVDAIESLEKEKLTAELISELARAYNNIGNLKIVMDKNQKNISIKLLNY